MNGRLDNEFPVIYGRRPRKKRDSVDDFNDDIEDSIDAREIFDLIRYFFQINNQCGYF